jgi:hypothetical protein
LAILSTPNTDHEVHREQYEFEENEEEDQILCDERARHAGLQHEHQDHECFGITRIRNVVPRIDDHQERDHHRQEVHRQADAVQANQVRRLDYWNPLVISNELHFVCIVVVELHESEDAHTQRCQRSDQGNQLMKLLLGLGNEQHHQHTGKRQEGAHT